MAVTVAWYITEVWKTGSTWSRDQFPLNPSNPLSVSTPVDVWFGTQAEWAGLTPAQQQDYDIHILDRTSGNTNPDLVNADELRTAMLTYSSNAYSIANNSGYLGTADIDLDNNPLTPAEPSVGLAIDGTSITASSHAIIITLDPITATSFTPNQVYQGGVGHFDPFRPGKLTPPCFLRGTMILTAEGEKLVEELKAGDLVMTADDGCQPITLIMSARLSPRQLAAQPDLRVSPQHRMLVRSRTARHLFGTDEILAAAKQLLCIEGVDIDDSDEPVEYFHILFDHHEIVFANGAPSESLYTGREALKGVSQAMRDEIYKLFPELPAGDAIPLPARMLVTGRMARKLARRHALKGRDLVA